MDAKPSRSKGDLREAGKKRLEEFRQKRQQKVANKSSEEPRSKLAHESQAEAASSLQSEADEQSSKPSHESQADAASSLQLETDEQQAGDAIRQQEETTEKENRSEEDGKRLEVLVENFQRKLEAVDAEKQVLVQENQKLSRRFNEQVGRHAKLKEVEDRLEDDKKRLETSAEELQKKLDEKELLLKENQPASQELNNRIEGWQQEIERLREKERRAEQENAKLEAVVEAIRAKLEAAVAEKLELLKENEELMQKLEANSRNLENLVRDLQVKLDAVVAEKDELAKENQTVSEQLDKQRIRHRQEQEELLKEQEHKQSTLVEETKQLEAVVGKLQTEMDALMEEKEKLFKENQTVLQQFNELATYQREREQMVEEMREKESRVEEAREQLEASVRELQRNLESTVSEKDALVIEKKTVLQQFNEQTERYQQEHEEITKLKQNEKHLEEDNQKLEALLGELQGKLAAMVADREELVKQNQTMLHHFKEQRTTCQREQEEMLVELRKKESRLQGDRKQLEAVIEELQQKSEAALAEKDAEKETSLHRFKEQMEKYQREREEEVAKLKEKENSLEEERKKLESLLDELERKLEAAVVEKDELVKENQRASDRCNDEIQRYQQEHRIVIVKEALIRELEAAAAKKDVEFKDRVERCKQDYEDVLVKLREKGNTLEAERHKLEASVRELQRKLDAVLEEKDQLDEQLKSYQEGMLRKVTEQETILEENRKKLEAVVEELHRSEDKVKALVEELERWKEKGKKSKAMIEELQKMLEEKHRNTTEQMKEDVSGHGELQDELDRLEAANEQQHAEIHRLQTAVQEYEACNRQLNEQMHMNEEARKVLLSDIEKFSLSLQSEACGSSLQEPITSYCEDIRSSFQSVTDLFQAKNEERRSLLRKIEDQSKLLDGLEIAASRLQSEWQTSEAGFQQEIHRSQEDNMQLVQQITLLKNHLQERTDSSEQVQKELQDVKTRLHSEHARVESLEAEKHQLLERLRQSRNESQEELVSVRRQLQDTKGAAEGLQGQLQLVNRKLIEEQNRLESLKAEKQQLKDQVLLLRSESQELQREREQTLSRYREEIIRCLESLFLSQHQRTVEKVEQVATEAESFIKEAQLRIPGLQRKVDLLETDALEHELQSKKVQDLMKEAVNILAPGDYFDAGGSMEGCVAAGMSIVSAVAEKEKIIKELLVNEQDMINELSRVRAHEEQLQLELQQETQKLQSTKEKLNLAVTNCKGLVQERDLLRKTIAEHEARTVALDEKLSKLKDFRGETNIDILVKVESFVEEFCRIRDSAAITKDRIEQLMEELSMKTQAALAVGDEKDVLLKKLEVITADHSQQKLQLEQKLEGWTQHLVGIFHTVAGVLSSETADDIAWSVSEDDIVKQLELAITALMSKFSTSILRNKGLSDEVTALGAKVKHLEEIQLRLQEEKALKDAEVQSVIGKWQKANADLARYTTEVTELAQQLASSKAMISSLNEDQKASQKKLEEAVRGHGRLQLELSESEQRLAAVREKLALAIKKGKSVSQQRDELKQMLADKTAAMELLQSSYQALEDAFTAAKMSQGENERALRDEIRTLTSKLDECRMLLQNASESETSLRAQLNSVTSTLKGTLEEKRLLQQELGDVSLQLKDAESRLEEAEQHLQSTLDSASSQRRLYEQDHKILEDKLDQVVELASQSEEKKIAALIELESMVLELLALAGARNVFPDTPQTATKLSITGLHQIGELFERELCVFVDKISCTKQLLQKAIEMFAPLKQMKAELAGGSVDDWLKTVQSLRVQISSKDAELESLTARLRDANEEIACLSQQLDELQTVIEENRTTMDSMESARSKAVGKLTYTVGHLTDLQKQCEAMLAEIENLHSDNVSLNEKIKLLEAELQDRNSYIIQLQKALALLLAKTNQQGTKATDSEELLEPLVLIDSLGTQTQRLVHENESLHATVQSKEIELQDLHRRLVASFDVQDTRGRGGSVAEPSVVEIEELEQAPRHTTAAHFRSQKKALVSDHVVVDMDSRSVPEVEDKGHGFKSLGLVRFFPRACHQFGDRVDALCLLAGRYLTRQPVARLLFILYSICIHFWLISALTLCKR